MAPNDKADPAETNPQASAPGSVKPERTPGTAPSVVPLPSGADPDAAPGEHPLPEQAIEGYPPVAELYDGTGGNGEGVAPVPDPVAEDPIAADAAAAGGSEKSKPSTSSTSKTNKQ